jgi:hypothetical protein
MHHDNIHEPAVGLSSPFSANLPPLWLFTLQRAVHPSCLFAMPFPTFGPYNFTTDFLSEFDFTAEFDFGLDFSYPPASETDSTFGDD